MRHGPRLTPQASSPLLIDKADHVCKDTPELQNWNRATICPCRGVPAAVVLSQPKPPVVLLFGSVLLTLVCAARALVDVRPLSIMAIFGLKKWHPFSRFPNADWRWQ